MWSSAPGSAWPGTYEQSIPFLASMSALRQSAGGRPFGRRSLSRGRNAASAGRLTCCRYARPFRRREALSRWRSVILISPEFCQCERAGSVSPAQWRRKAVSIMVNEEDHFRLQIMRPGFQLDEAYPGQRMRWIRRWMNVCISPLMTELGYLTQCPTNLGTGMRASIMLHLPGSAGERGRSSRIAGSRVETRV